MAKKKLFDKNEELKENKKMEEKEVKNEKVKQSEVLSENLKQSEVEQEELGTASLEYTKELKDGELINCDLLNARKEPNKESEVLFVIDKKDTIKILEELEDFYKVKVKDKEVYCMKNFIKIK